MLVLLDSNCLLFLVLGTGPFWQQVLDAIQKLRAQGATIHTTPQTLIEFRAAATRPQTAAPGQRPGLGMTPAQADAKIDDLLRVFPLLPDRRAVFTRWKRLVRDAAVSGKQVHDARLAAVCAVYHCALLTFNDIHFTRYLFHVPGLTVMRPDNV